jgi:hypothetical protein
MARRREAAKSASCPRARALASTAYDTVVSPFINSYNCLNGLTNGDFRGATPTCIKAAIGVGTLALLFVPGGEAVDVAGRGLISAGERGLVDRVAAEDGTALARQLGAEGERLSGIDAAAKVRIPSATGTAAYRIPDALTETTLTEVKNVARLGYSNQLQDFAAYASGNGRALNLIVRQNTVLTRGLQDLVDSGEINLIRSLPAR